MLGKLVKLHQHRQGVVNGVGLIYVPWYLSVREVVVGLEKNMFAVMDYSIPKNVFWSVVSLLFFLLPCGAVSFTSGITQ
ncbi:MAG TPA: glycosyl transferase, partial [Gammaproteobacteria bacterium]|nr:glycosyl transferase [Gammaproteobacteria bacterium]